MRFEWVTRQQAVAAQGIYYVVTGVWPLVHMRSFEAVTGPKADRWLVKMVGALVLVIGAVLCVAAARRRASEEMTLLAAGSAAAFAAVDTVYASRGRISPVYLLDAIAEAGLLAALILSGKSSAESVERRPSAE